MNTHGHDPVGVATTRHANTNICADYDQTVNRRLRLVRLAASVYGVALLLIAAWPTHVDAHFDVLKTAPASWLIERGFPSDKTYELIEASANVLLFIPLGVLLMLGTLRMTWLRAAAVGLVLSAGIEILQAVALPDRTANAGDVVANTLGATVGALGVVIWRWLRRRRAEVDGD